MVKYNKIQILVSILTLLVLSSDAKSIDLENIIVPTHFSSQQSNPVEFLKGFFKWYRTKFEYLNHYIHYVDGGYKTNTPYSINFHETERYLTLIKTSDFFSDAYINHARAYFKQVDLQLQQTKQMDGSVAGVDYDFMTRSHDPKQLFDDLDKINLELVTSTPFNSTVKVKTPFNQDSYLLYYLTKRGDKFLIDRIDFLIGGVVQK